MKKIITLLLFLSVIGFTKANAQIVSDFDSLLLPMPPQGAYWDGSDLSGGFVSGGMYFNNSYDTSFGGFWSSGFAYSSRVDSVTSGYTNLYAAKTASGFAGSSNYAVVQQNAVARTNNPFPTMVIHGFYVTNGTYAYNSMRDGDTFARKFGDTTGTNSGLPQGNYPDYFKLTVKSYVGGVLSNDSVEFYLADYRFSNDSLDYIVNTWEWVDCSILQVFDSLLFTLSSSDNGAFGMNTPAFFCIDNLVIDVTVGSKVAIKKENSPYVFPNPASQFINIKNLENSINSSFAIYNLQGCKIDEQNNVNLKDAINIDNLAPGIYYLKLLNNTSAEQIKFVKQ
ncbi:MAG TPA: DUF4465 domain-containing protein [Bacteroidia bacterium]|nr:DUF4465 domain-containing protein [Bacteroidia bacterium]